MDPMRLSSQDLPPHQLEAQTWAPKPATSHTPEQFFAPQPQQDQHTSVSGHFVPADQLLKDMGMAPLKAPPTPQEVDQTTSKPYVEPHKSSMAEFSPPRPTRRTLTVFAHLKNTPEDK